MADETTRSSGGHRPSQPASPAPGSRKARKRVGRGEGSGTGKTSGRGQKGEGSRSGAKDRARFEGGQMPIHMRMRKLRGPHMKKSMPFEPFRTHTQPVNLAGPRGALRRRRRGHARGAQGEGPGHAQGTSRSRSSPTARLTKALTVHAHKFSASAEPGHRGRRRHRRRRRRVGDTDHHRGAERPAPRRGDRALSTSDTLSRHMLSTILSAFTVAEIRKKLALHGAAARALPPGLAHPGAGRQRRGRRETSRSSSAAAASCSC